MWRLKSPVWFVVFYSENEIMMMMMILSTYIRKTLHVI